MYEPRVDFMTPSVRRRAGRPGSGAAVRRSRLFHGKWTDGDASKRGRRRKGRRDGGVREASLKRRQAPWWMGSAEDGRPWGMLASGGRDCARAQKKRHRGLKCRGGATSTANSIWSQEEGGIREPPKLSELRRLYYTGNYLAAKS